MTEINPLVNIRFRKSFGLHFVWLFDQGALARLVGETGFVYGMVSG